MKFKTKVFALYTDMDDGMELRVFATLAERNRNVIGVIENDIANDDGESANELRKMIADKADLDTILDFWRDHLQETADTVHVEDIELEADGQQVGPNRVFIVVEGGVIQDVLADDGTLIVQLIDHDNGKESDEAKAKNDEQVKQCQGLANVF